MEPENNPQPPPSAAPATTPPSTQTATGSHPLAFPVWSSTIAVALLATLASMAAAKSASEPLWEYKITSPDDSTFEKEANQEGAKGWEMVTARRASGRFSSTCYEIIWKRRFVKEKEKQPWER